MLSFPLKAQAFSFTSNALATYPFACSYRLCDQLVLILLKIIRLLFLENVFGQQNHSTVVPLS